MASGNIELEKSEILSVFFTNLALTVFNFDQKDLRDIVTHFIAIASLPLDTKTISWGKILEFMRLCSLIENGSYKLENGIIWRNSPVSMGDIIKDSRQFDRI